MSHPKVSANRAAQHSVCRPVHVPHGNTFSKPAGSTSPRFSEAVVGLVHVDVILVSTYTLDRVPIGSSGAYRETPGGPAHYIGEALERLGVEFSLITGERAVVEVIPTEDGQEYVIPPLSPIPLPKTLSARAIILSPIAREIDISAIQRVAGTLVVDLQGFVRDPLCPTDHPTARFELTPLIARSHVIKASTAELQRLTPQSMSFLDHTVTRGNHMLLRTDGQRGAYVTRHGLEIFVPAHPIQTNQTIGAGDTFLAAFVAATLRGLAPVEAATAAARFTEDVLLQQTGPKRK